MALLEDITKSLNICLKTSVETNQSSPLPISNIGKKRRAWLEPGSVNDDKVNDSDQIECVSKPLAKREQTVSKPLAIPQHSVSNALAKPLAEHDTIVNNFTRMREHSVSSQAVTILVGNERKLVEIIYDNCHENASLQTEKLTSEYLQNSLEISECRLRNLIFRVIKKKVIKTIEIKQGRGGWRRFELDPETYRYLRNALAKREQSVSKNALAEPLASVPSSSSININNNKTTTVLPDAWNFDLSDYEVFGFSKESLLQVYERQPNMPVEIIQDSLENFLWHHQRNNFPIFKKSPYEVLMGCLLKGLKFRSEARKKEIDSQARVEEKELQEELERASKLKFQKWVINKTDSEIEKYLSTQLIITLRSKGRAQHDVMNALYSHWLKN